MATLYFCFRHPQATKSINHIIFSLPYFIGDSLTSSTSDGHTTLFLYSHHPTKNQLGLSNIEPPKFKIVIPRFWLIEKLNKKCYDRV